MSARKPLLDLRRIAAAAALACTGLAPAWGVVTVTGNYNVYPIFQALGPGNTDLGSNTLALAGSGTANLRVDAGSVLSAASIRFADGGAGNVAIGVFDGVGTQVNLTGNGNTNRLELGAWGQGSLTVSGGATLNARANSADCLLGNNYCHNFIGNAAGSEALLTITGAGSNASFLRAFVVGGLAVFRPPIENFTFGTPGGTTRGRVEVLNGGSLTTDGGTLGAAPGGSSPLGTERSIAEMAIDGSNSVWHVTGGTLDNSGAFVSTGTHRNAWATLTVSNGGKLWFDGRADVFNGINLTSNRGRTDALVTGAGSQMLFTGDANVLQVGRSLGSASLQVLDGGMASGMFYLSVGRDGSVGDLLIDGAGSKVLVNGTASAAANGNSAPAFIDIGRNGTGAVTVSGGGQLLLEAKDALTNGPGMNLGRDAASSGTLNISGAGSVVRLTTQSVLPGGGPGESQNPTVRVGRDGSGLLNITNGGKLLIEGNAISTLVDRRSTALYIGGVNDTTVGGRGIATVSGAGSEIRVTGMDTFIGVGIGPQSNGQLTVSNQAVVSGIGMNVGRSGGVGVLKVDGAQLSFSGQQTAGNQSGAFLGIGHAGGVGVATITNGSTVTMTNPGSAGASLTLGGTTPFPGGDGSLTLSGASRIDIVAAPGLATLQVGRDGSALMRVKGASTVNVGDGNTFVGRLSGSDGTLLISEGSTLTTGWLGVGRNKTGSGDVDGGTGTLVLINSTVNAQNIVIGTNGFLGGTGTINGTVVNHGIFSPGNSPGTVEITGGFTAASGSRVVLEVQADGNGGFTTDHVIFGNGQALDLSGLNVEFRFLGSTDPTAFLASSHFDVDTFFQQRSAGGGTVDLAPEAFAQASFSASADAYAISNFSFSATGGAAFSATPVPEPGAWMLLAAGLGLVSARARRRRGG